MDIFEKYCGVRTFRFYALFVAVPGTNQLHRKLFVSFFGLVFTTSTIIQLLKFVTDGFSLKLLVSLTPTIAAEVACLVYLLYISFASHIPLQYECILSIMRSVANQERGPEEDAIREHYIASTKIFMNIYTMFLAFMVFGMSFSGLIPSFLDIVAPLNHTRKNELMYEVEVFIDQEKYFYYIHFFECLSCAVTCTMLITAVNMSVIIFLYSCSMSAILGYQLENLTEIFTEKVPRKMDYEERLMKRIRMCIKSHQTIIKYSLLVGDFYDIPLTLILIGSFCTLTMSLVQVTDPDLLDIKIILYTVGQTIQLFLVSLMGQSFMDASLQTSEDAYSAKWDMCPRKVRKMLQFIILRSSKATLIIARGLYVLSIENFMSVMQTVTSFYMVFRHAQ